MTRPLRYFLLVLAFVGCTVAVAAQDKSDKKMEKKSGGMQCGDSGDFRRSFSHCEIKEQPVPAGGLITVDGKQNGGEGTHDQAPDDGCHTFAYIRLQPLQVVKKWPFSVSIAL